MLVKIWCEWTSFGGESFDLGSSKDDEEDWKEEASVARMFTAWAPVAEAFVATARDFAAKTRKPPPPPPTTTTTTTATDVAAADGSAADDMDVSSTSSSHSSSTMTEDEKEALTAERRAEWRALLRRLPLRPTEGAFRGRGIVIHGGRGGSSTLG